MQGQVYQRSVLSAAPRPECEEAVDWLAAKVDIFSGTTIGCIPALAVLPDMGRRPLELAVDCWSAAGVPPRG